MVVLLQVVTIVLSRGDVFVLGEAYAYGVVWSFAFKALAMFVLRFKEADVPREWRVPMNPKIGGVEIPVGLGFITLVLFGVAFINIFTKKTATISGVAFTIVLYVAFVISERVTAKRRRHAHAEHTDQFQLMREADVGFAHQLELIRVLFVRVPPARGRHLLRDHERDVQNEGERDP